MKDQELETLYKQHPDRIVDIVIVCDEHKPAQVSQIEQTGVQITNTEQAEFGLIYGKIQAANLPRLEKLDGIEAISLDSTQYAL